MPVIRRTEQKSGAPFEGAHSVAMAGAATGSKYLTVGDLSVEPGKKSAYHIHPNTEESIFVVEGEVEFRVGNRRFRASAGDCVLANRGVGHGLQNVGNTTARLITMYPNPAPERQEIPEVDFVDGPPEKAVFFRGKVNSFEFAPGISRYDMVGDFTGSESTYFSELTFAPGSVAPNHFHPAHEEAMFCLEGSLMAVYAEDDNIQLQAGDMFVCEPTVRHGIYNASGTTAKLLAMHPVLNPPPRVVVD
jgi:quercetin dioxygenase-like cupin family protein